MLGRVFNQRYRLKEKIGSGGMADVYLADDLLLEREVAVKVLHAQFASDPVYIQRFRHEAQAAANLNHPNIVNVYDWGNEGDLYYIVMEYVEGRNLKEIIAEEGRLLPERAAEIAAEICSALQFAHRRNLVHRDIKPHNVVITNMGQVKVMDFGIARAGGGGMTQTGVVMGTPQYISPEQAQGKAVDGRSDIYSLGIVLYEMLTGRVPFDDPNPVTVTYKQVKEDPLPPSAVDPEIPPALEAVVMKALAKNPANRYQSAHEMKTDLQRFLEGVPVTATPVLPETAAAAAADTETGDTSSRFPWAWVAAGVVALLVVVGIILALVVGGGGAKVEVPNLVGMTEDQARQALEAAGLKLGNVVDQYIESESEQVGVVVAQDPEWGTLLAEGEKVNITVTRELRMPGVVGMDREQAESTLRKLGVTVIEITNTPVEDEDDVGKVLSQDPASGSLISPNVTVKLEVGVEQKKKAVPDVVGMRREDAEETLREAGFGVQVQEESSTEVAEGRVIRQSPLAGQKVMEGTTVTIVVSKGPSTVTVPDVRNMTEDQALDSLHGVGLEAEVVYQDVSDPSQVGKVVNQIPLPGAEVEEGYRVRIIVGKSP
jgi:serine/threonine-protein kinase